MDYIIEDERISCVKDGQVLAQITFPETAHGVYCINHTEVSSVLQGQGVAGRLVELAVKRIHEQGGRVTATCSYAAHWLAKHPECADEKE